MFVTPDGPRLAQLGQLLAAGTIDVTVSTAFPLEHVPRALADLRQGTDGRAVVLQPGLTAPMSFVAWTEGPLTPERRCAPSSRALRSFITSEDQGGRRTDLAVIESDPAPDCASLGTTSYGPCSDRDSPPQLRQAFHSGILVLGSRSRRPGDGFSTANTSAGVPRPSATASPSGRSRR